MNQKLPAIIGIAGFVIALGAVGDADCGTGSYIMARMIIGGLVMVGGWAWAMIRDWRQSNGVTGSDIQPSAGVGAVLGGQ